MKRTRIFLAAALVAALGCSASAGARALRAHAAATPTVEVRETKAGMIVVDPASGFTLYEFSIDKKKKDHCQTITMPTPCIATWPALVVTEEPVAGTGINPKKLKTTTLEDGEKQVMYANHPLYFYSGDTEPGEASYIGFENFGGKWWALTGKGKAVKGPPKGTTW